MNLPKTTFEQRSTHYQDVETLLSPGFLVHPIKIAGVRFQMRSLNSGDLFMLRSRAEGCSQREWRVWSVATSVWMVNGISVLGNDHAIPTIAQRLRGLPDNVLHTMFFILLGLFARDREAVSATMAYSYEVESRFKWAAFGQNNLMTHSGVPGVPKMGLNSVQQVWQAYNLYEDQRLQRDIQWEGFKLVASSNAPKAISKLDDRDRKRSEEENRRRDVIMDTYYYTRLGVLSPKVDTSSAPMSSHRVGGLKSVEELEEEMRRWVTGDADSHDKIVLQYKNHIRDKQAQEQADLEARRQALLEARLRIEADSEGGDYKPPSLVALTPEQLSQMLAGRTSGTMFIPLATHKDRVAEKYLPPENVTPGNLKMVNGKVVDPQADPVVDSRTLKELIQNRKPVFGSGE